MSTFHPFTRLPPELRLHIWDIAASEPRVVTLSEFKSKPYSRLYNLTSFTPPPSILHVSRESRSAGLKHYKKIYCTLVRQIWFNPDIDTVKLCSCVLRINYRYPGLEKIKHISIIPHHVRDQRCWMHSLSTDYPSIKTLDITFPFWDAEWCNEALDEWSKVHSGIAVRRIQLGARDGMNDTNLLERIWSWNRFSETALRCSLDVEYA